MAELTAERVPKQAQPAHSAATYGGFRQKPHVRKVNCQLSAKGAVGTEMEVSIQDRSKSAERSRRPLLYLL